MGPGEIAGSFFCRFTGFATCHKRTAAGSRGLKRMWRMNSYNAFICGHPLHLRQSAAVPFLVLQSEPVGGRLPERKKAMRGTAIQIGGFVRRSEWAAPEDGVAA